MFLGFPFIISYALIGYLSIHTYIFYFVLDFGALGVVQRIPIMGFLYVDKLSTVNL